MKLLIIGAAGNTGIALLDMARSGGHEVTAFVSSEEKLKSRLRDRNIPVPALVAGDVFHGPGLQQACAGQDALINVAGNVADGEQFERLVGAIPG